MKKNKQPEPPRTFVAGPSIADEAALLDWLESVGARSPRPRVRIPVVIRFDDGQAFRMADARLGFDASEAASSGLPLRLDDSAMGISLVDRLRQACPAGARVCCVWLEGYWGAGALPLPPSPEGAAGKRWPFSVRAVAGLVDLSDEDVRVFLEQEASTGGEHPQ